MLACRKKACKDINKIFGLNIDVELNSAWLKIAKEVINEVKQEEAEVDKTEAEAEAAKAATTETEENIIENKEGDTSETEEDKSNS